MNLSWLSPENSNISLFYPKLKPVYYTTDAYATPLQLLYLLQSTMVLQRITWFYQHDIAMILYVRDIGRFKALHKR